MHSITIRAATKDDAALLAELGKSTFHETFSGNPLMPQDDLMMYLETAFTVTKMLSELSEPQTRFILAEANNRAIGYAKLESGAPAAGIESTNPIKLKRLYARQNMIGFGIGKSLMTRCLDEALKLGHDVIWLTVWKHNHRAVDFYRKWNFVESGSIDFQLGNSVFQDKLMQRPVSLTGI